MVSSEQATNHRQARVCLPFEHIPLLMKESHKLEEIEEYVCYTLKPPVRFHSYPGKMFTAHHVIITLSLLL